MIEGQLDQEDGDLEMTAIGQEGPHKESQGTRKSRDYPALLSDLVKYLEPFIPSREV